MFKKTTILQLVSEAYEGAQAALLTAQNDFERAKHNLNMYTEREARLRRQLDALVAEDLKQREKLREQSA